MKILIVSLARDMHADAVKWGLGELGYQATMWFWDHFPANDSCSFEIRGNTLHGTELTLRGQKIEGPFDVIWLRRKPTPVPMGSAHPEDIDLIVRESKEYLENITPYLGHDKTLWINDITSDFQAEKKLSQLLVAAEIGFNVPDTFAGNSLDGIREFFYRHGKKVIFKAFSPAGWTYEDGSTVTVRTSLMKEEYFCNEYSIKACPGIYQPLIEKKYELRITVIGGNLHAAALDSQKKGATIDWRYDTNEVERTLRSIKLPPEIERKCFALCEKLGLKFGAIDMIVTNENEYVFLEVNNIGQFLFVEMYDPTITLLDMFCTYIAAQDLKFRKKEGTSLKIKDYLTPDAYRIRRETFPSI